MKLRLFLHVLLWIMLLSATDVSCAPAPGEYISLASFTENYVEVSIYLERNARGDTFISGTFTPPENYHLYSKDIPITGVNGLGRPTLLELTPNSLVKATGVLLESMAAEAPEFEPEELLIYPVGPVTLRLPVELPSGNDWIEDQIQVTYMACSAGQCKPPVAGKIVPIRIPGADAFAQK